MKRVDTDRLGLTDKIWDVIVIGGGPAGMMAAARASERGRSVLLLEKNSRLGKKLSITGGGRCNVTNNKPNVRTMLSSYKSSGKFLFSTFMQHGVTETKAWFESRGVELVEENHGRLFPSTHSAETICQVMENEIIKQGVKFYTKVEVTGIDYDSSTSRFSISLAGGESVLARSCILATGGRSRPETGSTGEGFVWLKKLGHTIIENDFALVPVAVKEKWVSQLSGITIDNVKVTILLDGVKQKTSLGKILFTHVGLSGPTILNMSKQIGELLKEGGVVLEIDLFANIEIGDFRKKLQEDLVTKSNQKLKNVLADFVPMAFTISILDLLSIDGEIPCHSVSKEDRYKLAHFLKHLPLEVKNLLGADKAVVSSGGVALTEIDFKTMSSRLIPNLYLVGDVLDIDRPSGGYSLQLCWSTGYVAGSHA